MKRLLFIATLFALFACENQVQDDPINLDERVDGLSVSEKYYQEGLEHYDNNDLEKAKASYRNAIEHAPSRNAQIQFKYYTKLMGVYMFKNEYGDALAILEEYALKDLVPEQEQELNVLYTRQSIMIFSKQYQDALLINNSLIELCQAKNDNNELNRTLIKRIGILQLVGRKQESRNLVDSLLTTNDLSRYQRSLLLLERGIKAFYDKEFTLAIESYKETLLISRDLKNDGWQNAVATQYANIAETYIELNQFDKAEVYLDSFRMIDQNKVNNNVRRSVFKYEMRLFQKMNYGTDRIEALIDKTSSEQEKFYKKRFDKELELLVSEKEKSDRLLKEKQIAEIEKLNLRNNSLLAGGFLLLILLVTLFWVFKQKRDQEIRDLRNQQRLLRAQMNPHFIFNVLSSIQNLVRTNAEQAPKFITKFSRMLRKVLENSTQNYVPLVEEVEVIRNYLDLQKLRFPKLFEYDIEVDESLDEIGVNIPPMLIQPFVENAIEHGFKGIDYVGELQLTLYPKKTNESFMVHCIVSDNGQGIRTSTPSNKKSVSFSLISDFIEKATKQKIKRYFYSPKTQTGTVIEFDIPTS